MRKVNQVHVVEDLDTGVGVSFSDHNPTNEFFFKTTTIAEANRLVSMINQFTMKECLNR